jgi:hypothetical protein
VTVPSKGKRDRDGDEVPSAASDATSPSRAGHARDRVVWTGDALPRGAAATRRQGRPSPMEPSVTPSLMDTLALAEHQIAQQLGEIADTTGLETDEAKRRLDLLFWARRQVDAIEDRRVQDELEHERRRDAVQRESAAGWLRVGNRASRFVLGAATVVFLIGSLAKLCVTGELDPSDLVRLLPW